MDGEVRIISLWEPYASAVALSIKAHETRAWRTRYRGWLLIHAAKRWTPEQWDSPAAACLRANDATWKAQLGRVVAVARLESCLPTTPMAGLYRDAAEPFSDDDRRLGDWSPGRWAWRLSDVRRLTYPPKWTGKQGLAVADPVLVELVRAQLNSEVVAR